MAAALLASHFAASSAALSAPSHCCMPPSAAAFCLQPWAAGCSERQARCRAGVVSPSNGVPVQPAAGGGVELRCGTGAVQGPREAMEDVTQVVEHGRCGYLYATVFDGHAGIAAANYLREHLYGILGDMLDQESLGLECSLEAREEGLCCPVELHAALTECYKRADRELLRWLAAQPGEERNAGCTATTALVRLDRIIVANVGDSRAVLSRGGAALDLSTEHRVYGRGPVVASETARIEATGGWVDDGRVCGVLAVSRAFGDADFKGEGLAKLLREGVEDGMWSAEFAASKSFTSDPVTAEPDVLEMPVRAEDEFLLVATDGLWDVISSQEAVKMVRGELLQGRHPREVAEKLAGVAVKRYTADNAAVVLVDLLGERGWAAACAQANSQKKVFGLF